MLAIDTTMSIYDYDEVRSRIGLAGPEVAEALEVAEGSALLSMKRIVRDIDGNGVEYLSGLYRPDMFSLEMPLVRTGVNEKADFPSPLPPPALREWVGGGVYKDLVETMY